MTRISLNNITSNNFMAISPMRNASKKNIIGQYYNEFSRLNKRIEEKVNQG